MTWREITGLEHSYGSGGSGGGSGGGVGGEEVVEGGTS